MSDYETVLKIASDYKSLRVTPHDLVAFADDSVTTRYLDITKDGLSTFRLEFDAKGAYVASKPMQTPTVGSINDLKSFNDERERLLRLLERARRAAWIAIDPETHAPATFTDAKRLNEIFDALEQRLEGALVIHKEVRIDVPTPLPAWATAIRDRMENALESNVDEYREADVEDVLRSMFE